ncbi:hypothetical protein PR048_029042 [Dryococelus australis]|uniref:Uncharacterized protein n=1 Tax=Dryococelus australis TaxID=614101 RepID=A0ABQ9GFU3_9NEOP|nr:hypothetical protein PR048_029042 [Dryococelus australis]
MQSSLKIHTVVVTRAQFKLRNPLGNIVQYVRKKGALQKEKEVGGRQHPPSNECGFRGQTLRCPSSLGDRTRPKYGSRMEEKGVDTLRKPNGMSCRVKTPGNERHICITRAALRVGKTIPAIDIQLDSQPYVASVSQSVIRLCFRPYERREKAVAHPSFRRKSQFGKYLTDGRIEKKFPCYWLKIIMTTGRTTDGCDRWFVPRKKTAKKQQHRPCSSRKLLLDLMTNIALNKLHTNANYSPTTKAKRVRFPAGLPSGFRIRESCLDDASGRRVTSGISRFSGTCIPELLRTRLASSSTVLKISLIKSRPNLFTHSQRSTSGEKRTDKTVTSHELQRESFHSAFTYVRGCGACRAKKGGRVQDTKFARARRHISFIATGYFLLEKEFSNLTGPLRNRRHRHGSYVIRMQTVNTCQKVIQPIKIALGKHSRYGVLIPTVRPGQRRCIQQINVLQLAEDCDLYYAVLAGFQFALERAATRPFRRQKSPATPDPYRRSLRLSSLGEDFPPHLWHYCADLHLQHPEFKLTPPRVQLRLIFLVTPVDRPLVPLNHMCHLCVFQQILSGFLDIEIQAFEPINASALSKSLLARYEFIGILCFFHAHKGPRWCRGQTTRLPPTRTGFDSRRGRSGFSHVGIVPDDAAGRRVFSGICISSPPLLSGAAPYSPHSPSSALKTSMLRAAHISQLNSSILDAVNICAPFDKFPSRRKIFLGEGASRVSATPTTLSMQEVALWGWQTPDIGRRFPYTPVVVSTAGVEKAAAQDNGIEVAIQQLAPIRTAPSAGPCHWLLLLLLREELEKLRMEISNLFGLIDALGATVAERLARLPPTKANRARSPDGSPDFRKWESCRTMPLVGGFSTGFPVFPAPSFRRRSIFTSITLIGSQGLADDLGDGTVDVTVVQITRIRIKLRGSTVKPIRVIEVNMERRRNEGAGKTGNPVENPPTNGIVRHDSHLRKSGDPSGDRARFALVGGKRANRSATVAPRAEGAQLVYSRAAGDSAEPEAATSARRRRNVPVFCPSSASRPTNTPCLDAARRELKEGRGLPLHSADLSDITPSLLMMHVLPFRNALRKASAARFRVRQSERRIQKVLERPHCELTLSHREPMRVERKPARQRYRLARFPHAKIKGAARPGIEPVSPKWEANSITNTPPRPLGGTSTEQHQIPRQTSIEVIANNYPADPIWILALANEGGEPPSLRHRGGERLARSPPTKANRVQSPGRAFGFSQVGIVPSEGFLGDLSFPRPFIPAPLHTLFNHPHRSALKSSRLSVAQISTLTHSLRRKLIFAN